MRNLKEVITMDLSLMMHRMMVRMVNVPQRIGRILSNSSRKWTGSISPDISIACRFFNLSPSLKVGYWLCVWWSPKCIFKNTSSGRFSKQIIVRFEPGFDEARFIFNSNVFSWGALSSKSSEIWSHLKCWRCSKWGFFLYN